MDVLLAGLIAVAFSVGTLILLGLGLAIIFGMMGVLNLAQGEFLMLGAYTVLIADQLGISLWVGILIAPAAVGLIGMIIERTIIRALYDRPLDTMLATWGLSLLIIGAVTLIMGPATRGVAAPLGHFTIGSFHIAFYSLLVVALAAALLALTYVLFVRTRYGLVARAAMQHPVLTAASGIEPSVIYMATFGFGAALSGLAGAILAPLTGVVPSLGLVFIAKIFITVIVGGPVILLGTTSSAALLGVVDSAISRFSTPIYGQVGMLVTALIILRLTPRGLSGSWHRGI
jgi:branched-chain amino acid transport system permease protein